MSSDRPCIVVVDDNFDDLQIIYMALSYYSLEVHAASSAEQCADLLEARLTQQGGGNRGALLRLVPVPATGYDQRLFAHGLQVLSLTSSWRAPRGHGSTVPSRSPAGSGSGRGQVLVNATCRLSAEAVCTA